MLFLILNLRVGRIFFMALPKQVRIVDVGPRDGLQNEKHIVPLDVKRELIERLAGAGLKTIEAGAFVSPKWVPQMADTAELFQQIDRRPGISYPVLVPNLKGMEKAVEVGAGEIAIFAAASESFSQKNINCSVDESIDRFKPVMDMAQKHNIKVRGYVSCVLGCPYDGEIPVEKVAEVSKRLYELGCYEISLGDTIGIGTPLSTSKMLESVLKEIDSSFLAVHFHDTYNRALENIKIALEMEISVIDSSVGGLGGCPYAKGATGNVATESVLELLNEMKIETGIDIKAVKEIATWIHGKINS